MLLYGNINTIFSSSGSLFECSRSAQLLRLQHRTSADRNLAGPAAVRAANTVLGAPREKITQLTGVYQGVAVGGQVQTHHVSVGRAPRLLAGVSWRAGRRTVSIPTYETNSALAYQLSRRHTFR